MRGVQLTPMRARWFFWLPRGSKRFSWNFAGRRPCLTYMDARDSGGMPTSSLTRTLRLASPFRESSDSSYTIRVCEVSRCFKAGQDSLLSVGLSCSADAFGVKSRLKAERFREFR
jgi:hypothetical protein